MTDKTEDQDVARGEDLLRALSEAVVGLRQEIEALAGELRRDGQLDEAGIKQALSKIRGLVTECGKAENFLNESTSKRSGIAHGGHALDLDRARVEIGCKLDRLRRCGRPRAISE